MGAGDALPVLAPSLPLVMHQDKSLSCLTAGGDDRGEDRCDLPRMVGVGDAQELSGVDDDHRLLALGDTFQELLPGAAKGEIKGHVVVDVR
jgi:hypothetical protein